MKKSKKINLATMAATEINRQQLNTIKGGQDGQAGNNLTGDLFPCACFRQEVRVRSMGNRRAY